MKTLLCFVTLLLLAAGCSSIKVSSDFDNTANFASYKTYAFTPEVAQLPIDDINRFRITDAVINELAAKGFTKSDQPDVWTDMNITAQQKQTSTATSSPSYYGGGYRYGWGG